jgi:hypothetical protein
MSENRKTLDHDSPIIRHAQVMNGKHNFWGDYRPWDKYGPPVWLSKEALDVCDFEPYLIQVEKTNPNKPPSA